MRDPQRLRKLSYVLAGFAIFGILFSLLGIASVWVLRPRVTNNLRSVVSLSHETLETTQSAITVLSGSLDQAGQDLDLIQSSMEKLSESMDSLSSSLTTSTNLIGDDLNLTLTEVQTALSSAATSAEFIDDTLAFIAAIPLIGADYQPDPPLHISLAKVAESLEDVPTTLSDLETGLDQAALSLEDFATDLSTLSEDLESTLGDLEESQVILTEYDSILSQALSKLEQIDSHLTLYSVLITMFLTGMLLWLGIAQVYGFIQAQDNIHYQEKIVTLADLNRE
jgi:predicted PurR-regulated permease PerM